MFYDFIFRVSVKYVLIFIFNILDSIVKFSGKKVQFINFFLLIGIETDTDQDPAT
jgi:hypothetical protein